jgi:alanyl-tRNA synthetase
MRAILSGVEELCGKPYYRDQRGFPFRVIADHIRSCVFLISDGVSPSNVDRGYVLRRILRRAIRFGKLLGIDGPFMYKLVPLVIQQMGEAYPELVAAEDMVTAVIRREEDRFHETLDAGLRLAQEIVARAREKGERALGGQDLFRLYDTYGFPFDLAQDIAEEAGLAVDQAGFDEAMARQRRQSRESRKEKGGRDLALLLSRLGQGEPTVFLGYEELTAQSGLQLLAREGEAVDSANEGEEVWLIFDRTPFYAASGGQVSDRGSVAGQDGSVQVESVYKLPDGRFVHQGVVAGQIRRREIFTLRVEARTRRRTAANHTATHLLHKALREVLGEHVYQAGSAVEPERLRFDFAHHSAMTGPEISRVEELVNEAIAASLPVTTEEKEIEEARREGAVALFGEKYGDTVRVVAIGDYSKELCGGTHLSNSAQAGLFRIVSEGAVSAGVRRIEAVTGAGVLELLAAKERSLESLAALLKTPAEDLEKKARNLLESNKEYERALNRAEGKMAALQSDGLLSQKISVAGMPALIARVEARDMEGYRALSDAVREKLGSGVAVLGTVLEDKASFIVTVSADLVARGVHAGNLVREIAKAAGGGGGGRPDMAQAGGRDAGLLDAALERAKDIIASLYGQAGGS